MRGPTTSAPVSDGEGDDRDTEMGHDTPFAGSFMAEPTALRLVGSYGAAEQDSDVISSAILTATVWLQTMSQRPEVFEDFAITSTLRRRIDQFVTAAGRHSLTWGNDGIDRMEEDLNNLSLHVPPGPPMPALGANMGPIPPQQRPVDRKGKAPACAAPRAQPIKPVVPFQRPQPLVNPATHPRKSFAAAVCSSKGPVKAAAPIVQPAAAIAAAGPSRPETPCKRKVPGFTSAGPTRKQVLIDFGQGKVPALDIARLHTTVNQALMAVHSKVAVLSSGAAYNGFSLSTDQVANSKDLEIICGAVVPLFTPGLSYWVGLPTSTLYIKIVDVPYYSDLPNKVLNTVAEVKAVIAASPLSQYFKYAAEPCIVRNSATSTTAKVYINLWDSQMGTQAKAVIDRPILFGTRSCYVRAANANPGAPLCQRCWRWGHTIGGCKAPQLRCNHCAGPHESDAHRHACGLCKGNPKSNPPVLPTAAGQPCPHPARCPNCRENHNAMDRTCSFWRHRFDPQWITAKYSEVRVHRARGRTISNNRNVA